MKRHLLTIIFLIFTIFLKAQNTFTYKPNPITGNLEVFKTSQGNNDYPQKVAEIVKNPITGYMEIKEFGNQNNFQQSSSEPYTNRPNFDLVKQIKPFDFPYQALIDQITTLNKRAEYDIIQKQLQDKSISDSKQKAFIESVKASFDNMTNIANNLLGFYNSQSKFPSRLSDGYYYTTELENQLWVNADNKTNPEKKNGYFIKTGITRIENNKIIEYYESTHNDMMSKESNVFRKFNLEVKGNVDKCKVTFREAGSSKYISIYFFDNIIDSTINITNPNFGLYTIFTDGVRSDFSPDKNRLIGIKIARNYSINSDASLTTLLSLPYTSTIVNNNNSKNNSCNNSSLTFAFKPNLGTFNIAVRILNLNNNKEDKWTINDIKITAGSCGSSILN